MELGRYSTDLASLEKMMVCSVLKAVAVEALLTVQNSLAFLLTMAFQTESVFNNAIALPKLTQINERFPLEDLNKRKQQPDLENKDADDSENDDEDGDEDGDDASDEDFSGEEEGGEDEGEEEEKGKTPEANGNGVSDDDEDEDDEDGEDDEDDEDGEEDDEDEEDEEDEDEDDEDQPPAKKRK